MNERITAKLIAKVAFDHKLTPRATVELEEVLQSIMENGVLSGSISLDNPTVFQALQDILSRLDDRQFLGTLTLAVSFQWQLAGGH